MHTTDFDCLLFRKRVSDNAFMRFKFDCLLFQKRVSDNAFMCFKISLLHNSVILTLIWREKMEL